MYIYSMLEMQTIQNAMRAMKNTGLGKLAVFVVLGFWVKFHNQSAQNNVRHFCLLVYLFIYFGIVRQGKTHLEEGQWKYSCSAQGADAGKCWGPAAVEEELSTPLSQWSVRSTTCLLGQRGNSQPSQGTCTESRISIGPFDFGVVATGLCVSPFCWWPWSRRHHWSPALCLMLCVLQQPSHGGTQPAPVARHELFNWAQTLKTGDTVCGSCPCSPECANMSYNILLVALCPWDIRMTRVHERRPPRGNVFAQWFVQLILGISSGKGSPCSAGTGCAAQGDEGWLQKDLGVS